MAYYVYILYSDSTDTFYRGQTNNVEKRLIKHNAGYETYTAKGRPWTLIWYTEKKTRSEAIILERKLKNLDRERLVKFMKKHIEDCVGPDALIFLNQWSGC